MDRAPDQVWVFAQLSLPASTAPEVAQGQSNAQTGGRAGGPGQRSWGAFLAFYNNMDPAMSLTLRCDT